MTEIVMGAVSKWAYLSAGDSDAGLDSFFERVYRAFGGVFVFEAQPRDPIKIRELHSVRAIFLL